MNMVPGLGRLLDFREAVEVEETRTRLESRARVFSRVPNLEPGARAAIAQVSGGQVVCLSVCLSVCLFVCASQDISCPTNREGFL